MKYISIFLTLFCYSTMNAQNLSNHIWTNRLLLIYDVMPHQSLLIDQLAILSADTIGLEERKLAVYQFQEEKYRRGVKTTNEWTKSTLPFLLQKRLKPNQKFGVFLIGLDGGIKLHQWQHLSFFSLNIFEWMENGRLHF